MNTIKTITLHQPYASLITDSFKIYETRSWSTPYRGLLAIHAGKKWDGELQDITGDLAERFPELRKYIQHAPPLGAVLGICRLVHCHETETIRNSISKLERAVGDWGDGRFAWELQLLEVFDERIPAAGAQKLWDWTPPKGFFDNRVAIIGSRDFPDKVTVYEYVQKLPQDTIVISGGAKGVDEAAEYAARKCELKVISIPVSGDEWTVVGKHAGHVRNQSIIDMAGRVVAFHHGGSAGTANSIQKAKATGKHLIVNPHKGDSSLGELMTYSIRHARDTVMPIAQEMAGMLRIACDQLYIAGSLRRGKPDVKDAELVAVPKLIDGHNALWWLLDKLLEEGAIQKAPYGETGTTRWGEKYRGLLYKDLKIEIFSSLPTALGYQYWLRTGPGDSNMLLMKLLKSKAAPFRVENGQVWWNDVALNIPDEKAWFKLLGIPLITPGQRTETSLQDAFDGQWQGWGNPKDFVQKAQQLTLGGEFNMHDEGALIAYLEKKEKLKPDVHLRTNYQWDKPWLFDSQHVWVADKQYGFKLVYIDSREAALQARKLSGFYYGEYTTALIDWLNDQRGEVPTPNYRPEYDKEGDTFPYAYIFNRYFDENFNKDTLVEMCLALTDIQPTQDTVSYGLAKRYFRDHVQRDENGNLPLGIKFQDTPVLLINGHHRYAGNWWADVQKMTVMVDILPITFAEAFTLDEDDGSADLELFADILEEVYEILKEAKELEHA